jgi:hypothetical protein
MLGKNKEAGWKSGLDDKTNRRILANALIKN